MVLNPEPEALSRRYKKTGRKIRRAEIRQACFRGTVDARCFRNLQGIYCLSEEYFFEKREEENWKNLRMLPRISRFLDCGQKFVSKSRWLSKIYWCKWKNDTCDFWTFSFQTSFFPIVPLLLLHRRGLNLFFYNIFITY